MVDTVDIEKTRTFAWEASEDFERFSNTLRADLGFAFEQSDKKPDSQFFLRTLVRTFSAYVEGTSSYICEFIYARHKFKSFLTDDEVFCVKQSRPFLDNNGEIKKRPEYSAFPHLLYFGWKTMPRVFGFNKKPQLIKQGSGYKMFLEMNRIRNSLMHPKTIIDIELSPTVRESILSAIAWVEFQNELSFLLPTIASENLAETAMGLVDSTRKSSRSIKDLEHPINRVEQAAETIMNLQWSKTKIPPLLELAWTAEIPYDDFLRELKRFDDRIEATVNHDGFKIGNAVIK